MFMQRNFWLGQLPVTLMIGAGILTAIAWQSQPTKTLQSVTDTLPERSKKIRDADDVLNELEKSKAELDKSIQSMDWQKMQKEFQSAQQKMQLDQEKMQNEVAR